MLSKRSVVRRVVLVYHTSSNAKDNGPTIHMDTDKREREREKKVNSKDGQTYTVDTSMMIYQYRIALFIIDTILEDKPEGKRCGIHKNKNDHSVPTPPRGSRNRQDFTSGRVPT